MDEKKIAEGDLSVALQAMHAEVLDPAVTKAGEAWEIAIKAAFILYDLSEGITRTVKNKLDTTRLADSLLFSHRGVDAIVLEVASGFHEYTEDEFKVHTATLESFRKWFLSIANEIFCEERATFKGKKICWTLNAPKIYYDKISGGRAMPSGQSLAHRCKAWVSEAFF